MKSSGGCFVCIFCCYQVNRLIKLFTCILCAKHLILKSAGLMWGGGGGSLAELKTPCEEGSPDKCPNNVSPG